MDSFGQASTLEQHVSSDWRADAFWVALRLVFVAMAGAYGLPLGFISWAMIRGVGGVEFTGFKLRPDMPTPESSWWSAAVTLTFLLLPSLLLASITFYYFFLSKPNDRPCSNPTTASDENRDS